MENFWEEKEISISCKGTLKHYHFSSRFMIGFAHCRLLHFQLFLAQVIPERAYPHTLIHMDIVITTYIMLTAVEVLAPRTQLTTRSRLCCLTDHLPWCWQACRVWWCLQGQLEFRHDFRNGLS